MKGWIPFLSMEMLGWIQFLLFSHPPGPGSYRRQFHLQRLLSSQQDPHSLPVNWKSRRNPRSTNIKEDKFPYKKIYIYIVCWSLYLTSTNSSLAWKNYTRFWGRSASPHLAQYRDKWSHAACYKILGMTRIFAIFFMALNPQAGKSNRTHQISETKGRPHCFDY